jgi:hypothetical protein
MSSPTCWVKHISAFKTISLHGTDDWKRGLINSPVVNKLGHADRHVSVIKSQSSNHQTAYSLGIKRHCSFWADNLVHKDSVLLGGDTRCVNPHALKDYTAFIFRVKQSSVRAMTQILSSFKMLAATWACRWKH